MEVRNRSVCGVGPRTSSWNATNLVVSVQPSRQFAGVPFMQAGKSHYGSAIRQSE